MRSKRTKQLLIAASLGSVSASVCLFILFERLPLDVPAESGPLSSRVETRTEMEETESFRLSEGDLRVLSERNFRKRLFDPPPPLVKKPEPKPPPRVQVVGTILSAAPMAIVATEGGKTEFKKVGEKLGTANNPATLIDIQRDRITIEHLGEHHEVLMNSKR